MFADQRHQIIALMFMHIHWIQPTSLYVGHTTVTKENIHFIICSCLLSICGSNGCTPQHTCDTPRFLCFHVKHATANIVNTVASHIRFRDDFETCMAKYSEKSRHLLERHIHLHTHRERERERESSVF